MKENWWARLPWWLFYLPMAPWICYTWLRLRGKRINPIMDNDGLYNSSKTKYLSKLPSEWVPNMEPTKYPMVAKPDAGERGRGVKIIHHDKALKDYIDNATGRVLLQDFVDLPHECSIFWAGNNVTGLTLKRLPESLIGSHNLGCGFIDGRLLITPQLNEAFRIIVSRISGFSYGRFDIKYRSLSDLSKLKNFKILEINGINAEPTWIYDPRFKLLDAYKEIIKHWNLCGNSLELIRRSYSYSSWPVVKETT